jgi:hypothetical protein
MTDSTTSTPEPNHVPGGLDSAGDFEAGADNGPDILQGVSEDEPDLDSVIHHDSISFRTPVAGERLTDDELERDVE